MNVPFPLKCMQEGRHFASPIERVLALGYYDGPTEGVLRCGSGEVYRFELLAWDDETQDLRVFALAPLPPTAWDQLVEVACRSQLPHWPLWMPHWQGQMREPIDHIWKQAGPVAWVVATENLLGEILAARPVSPDEVERVTEWGSYLSLEGAPPLPARQAGLR